MTDLDLIVRWWSAILFMSIITVLAIGGFIVGMSKLMEWRRKK